MKRIFYVPIVIMMIGCSTPNNQNTEKEEPPQVSTEKESAEKEDTANTALKGAITGDEPLRAFELLATGNIENSLEISDQIWMWYETEPFFKSWLVSAGKIKEGPEYHYVVDMKTTELLEANNHRELLVHSAHHPFVNIDGYSFSGGSDYLGFSKILETSYARSDEDQGRVIKIDLNDRNYGIPSDFDIVNDRFEVLHSSKYFRISESLLNNENKPFNIASYFKFYSKDLEEAERILSGDEQFLKDRLDTLDIRNGYMTVYFDGEGESNGTEYVYWNLSDGRKLLGVNEITYDFIGNTFTSFFEFKAFNENRWEPFDIGDLADLKNKSTGDDLQSTALMDKIFPGDEIAQVVDFKLELPQKGKDIELTLMRASGDEGMEEMKTVWLKFNDGKFEYLPQ